MMIAAGCNAHFAPDFASGATAEELTADTSTTPAPQIRYDSDAPAYVLFTSGSTGAPKPVATPRRAITTTVRALVDLFDLEPSDRVLQFASLNWDTCFEEILPTLTVGATLVLHREAHTGSFPRFLRMVEHERITVLNLPTAFWHELVHYLTDTGTSLPDCVRTMVIGGEAINPARLAGWRTLDTAHIRLLNTYGCTETTLITHAVDLHGPRAPRFDTHGERAPIGRPLPHVVERITDDGELWIGGPALALGYVGMPEATDTRFVTVDDARYFRTGDRVTRTDDGMLVPAGRLDHEVKVRGIRVDPAEVEAQIASHPAVHAVAVVGATVAGRTALLGYAVPRPGADGRPPGAPSSDHASRHDLPAEITEYLRSRVPEHLIPSRITVVDDLVHTASGKVDRTGTHRRYAVPPPRQPSPVSPIRRAATPTGTAHGRVKELPDER